MKFIKYILNYFSKNKSTKFTEAEVKLKTLANKHNENYYSLRYSATWANNKINAIECCVYINGCVAICSGRTWTEAIEKLEEYYNRPKVVLTTDEAPED